MLALNVNSDILEKLIIGK